MATLQLGYAGPELDKLVALLDKHGFWPHQVTPKTFNTKVDGAVRDFQATALNSKGKALKTDGEVGDQTWWALRNYTGKGQKLNLPNDRIPKGLSDVRVAILKEMLALHDAGVKERPNGSNRSKEIDKLLPTWWMNKYGKLKPQKKGPAWCCFTYMTCYKRATGEYVLGRQEGSCSKAAERAKAKGIYATKNPIPGDCGLLLHGNGKGHAVTIYRVSKDGKTVTTVEGNCANRVAIRERKVDTFTGFIRADNGRSSKDFQRGLVKAKKIGNESTR